MSDSSPADRLRQARIKAGFETATDAARRFGFSVNTYPHHENGNRGITPQTAARYARAFKVTPGWLLYGEAMPDPTGEAVAETKRRPILLPVAGVVAAGLWREVDQWDEERYPAVSFVPDRFPGLEHTAYRVEGSSVNQLGINHGDTVITVPYWTVRSAPTEGDVVVVRRRKGTVVETTCKQLEVKAKRFELWPRSDDPKFKMPLVVPRDSEADDQEVEIVGLVIAVQREFRYG